MSFKNAPHKITLVYLLTASLWILLSDKLLASMGLDEQSLTTLQTYKGWFFVLVTSLILYSYLYKIVGNINSEMKERTKAEENAVREKQLLKSITETTPIAIFVFNTGGEVTFMNTFAEKLLKLSRQETANLENNNRRINIYNIRGTFLKPEELPYNLVLKDKKPRMNEYLVVQLQGNNKITISVNTVPLFDIDNNLAGAVTTALDITDKVKADEKLHQSEQLLDMFFNSSMDGFYISLLDEPVEWNKDNDNKEVIKYVLDHERIIKVNESFCIQYGADENKIIGMTPRQFFEHDYDTAFDGWYKLYQAGTTSVITEEQKLDGTPMWIEGNYIILYDETGKIKGHIGTQRDITDRKAFEDKLIEAKDKAEQADKLKTDFLAQISHEIRTPINVILNSFALLRTEYRDKIEPEHREFFKIIESAGDRIIRTIDLILNMAVLQSGSYKPAFRRINVIEEILNQLMLEYSKRAEGKNLKLSLIQKTDELMVSADTYSLSQIFANILDNAIKYTNYGKIEIIIGRNNNNDLCIEVKDTGIGIEKDYLEQLFEPFSQYEQGYTRSYEGNGLGLALVKKYCEINNARIRVTSEVNKGSSFSITFYN